jgi:hypothetical protein
VRLVSPIGSAAGGSGNLSTSLSNFARLAAHPKFVWLFNANYDGTFIPRYARISIWPRGPLEKPILHRNELHTKLYSLKRRPPFIAYMNFFSMHPSSPFSCRFSLIPNFTPVIIPPVALPFSFSVMCERFYSKLYEIFDLHVPLKKCTTRHYPVWFNSAIIAKIRKKSNVFKKYKRTGLPSYFLEFKNLRRDVKREIDVAFRDYISKVQENLVGDPKKFWSFVNNRKGRSRIPSRMSNGGHALNSFSEIVNSFATHFKNSYDTADAPANLIDVLGNATFHLYTVSNADILESIGLLKSGLCSGDDGIPAFLMKDCKYLLLPPLRVLFNQVG